MTPEDKVAAIDEKLAAADGLSEPGAKPESKAREGLSAEKLAVEFDDNDKPITPESIEEGDVPLTAEDFGPIDPEAPPLAPEEQEAKSLQTEQVALQQEQATLMQHAQALAMRQREIQRMVTSGQYDDATALAMHEQMEQQQAVLNQAAAQFQNKAAQYASKHDARFMQDVVKLVPEWADTKLMEQHKVWLSDWLTSQKRMSSEQKNALSPTEIAEHHREMMGWARKRKAERMRKVKKVAMPSGKDSDFYRGIKATIAHNKRDTAPVPLKDTTGDFASRFRSLKQSNIAQGMNPTQAHKAARDKLIHERA